MKKIALASLFAVLAGTAGANAANVINGNPMYRPGEKHFYSVTSLETEINTPNDSDFKGWGLGEEFGYGITKELAVILKTSMSQFDSFDVNSWNDLSLGLNYRVMDMNEWKGDVYGSLEVNPVWGDHADFMEENMTAYTWVAGYRAGYVTENWTLAAFAEYQYMNSEAFNWGDEGLHNWSFGLDGQYVIDGNWNLVAGLQYDVIEDNPNDDPLNGKIGVNYNLDATKYVGLYTQTRLNPEDGEDTWGLGVKFGIDF